jgi:hypothetical protein
VVSAARTPFPDHARRLTIRSGEESVLCSTTLLLKDFVSARVKHVGNKSVQGHGFHF